MELYFSGEEAVYNESTFAQRFALPRCVVLQFLDVVEGEKK